MCKLFGVCSQGQSTWLLLKVKGALLANVSVWYCSYQSTRLLEAIPQKFEFNLFQGRSLSRLEGIYDAGQDGFQLVRNKVENSLETAQKSSSISTEVLTYRLGVQLNVQMYNFYKNASATILAPCYEMSTSEFRADIRKKLEGLLTETREAINQGLKIATSSQQVWLTAYL